MNFSFFVAGGLQAMAMGANSPSPSNKIGGCSNATTDFVV